MPPPRSSRVQAIVGFFIFAALSTGSAIQAVKNPAQLAAGHGYGSETRSVITEDGFVLDVFRIWNATARPDSPEGAPPRPVIIMPGLVCNAAIWVLTGPGKALAYSLADRGYDVWLGSYRGNMFARKHVNLTDYDPAFWDFSWQEHGQWDLPAVLEHVSTATNGAPLRYVCHSMGCTMLMVMSSSRPELARRLRVSAAYMMAPVAFMGHSSAPLFMGAALMPALQAGLSVFGSGEIPLNSWWVRTSLQGLCGGRMTVPICMFLEAFTTGGDSQQTNKTEAALYLQYVPDSASSRDMNHFVQHLHKVRTFCHFDYGAKLNAEKYGQEEPPLYDLSRTDMPVSIYYGDDDILANPEDVLDLSQTLPRLARPPYRVPYAKFSHMDFFFGMNAKSVLYDQLVADIVQDDRDRNSV